MQDKDEYRFKIDYRLESYTHFFDHKWAEEILNLTDKTSISDATFAFTAHWRGIANTHLMPSLMAGMLNNYNNRFITSRKSLSMGLIQAYTQRLTREMSPYLEREQKQKLAIVMARIGDDVEEADSKERITSTPEEIWTELLELDRYELRMSLWGSQFVCYCGLFHAYENYIRRCVGIVKQEPEYRPHFKKLICHTRQELGDSIADDCLTDDVITIARHVRNSLAHNGGRVTDELKQVQHGLTVIENTIHVLAHDTRQLYDALKVRAYQFAEAVVKLIEVGQEH